MTCLCREHENRPAGSSGASGFSWRIPRTCPIVSQGRLDPRDVQLLSEGAGKTIDKCQKRTVLLSLHGRQDREIRDQFGADEMRRLRLQRIAEEAREQGGVLSQEDLAEILCRDVRTIRRDICMLRQRGIIIPTRGQQKDIGPTLSHKGLAIRRWLQGDEPLEVARRIKHTLHSVERYIQRFSRVVFLHRKGFPFLQIALTVGISSSAVSTYLEIYDKTRWQSQYHARYEEIDLIGAQHYEAEDAKKGGPSRPQKRNGAWRRP